jgi:ComF family protein
MMRVHPLILPVVDLIFPPRCPLCGEALAAQDGLCAACWQTLAIPGEPCCALCQRPFPDGTADELHCAPCMAEPPIHDGIAAGTIYNAPTRRLILAFKHGRRIAYAPMLARLILARLRGVDDDWLIVPVPLHRWRIFSRGYNQSALLAAEIARATGARMIVDGLHRHKATPSLGPLGAKARARVLNGAIRLGQRHTEAFRGRNVLLVDDVLTSGATTNACVAVLRRAGAARVRIACFARVLGELEPGG